eukprot:GHVL01019042.1.p1 GENE.GHVL01019042.1~~GHVL01019042.1.p1  ORF type:complete len:2235 (+),score=508.71 GHVL01019042.1:38-6742(+)
MSELSDTDESVCMAEDNASMSEYVSFAPKSALGLSTVAGTLTGAAGQLMKILNTLDHNHKQKGEQFTSVVRKALERAKKQDLLLMMTQTFTAWKKQKDLNLIKNKSYLLLKALSLKFDKLAQIKENQIALLNWRNAANIHQSEGLEDRVTEAEKAKQEMENLVKEMKVGNEKLKLRASDLQRELDDIMDAEREKKEKAKALERQLSDAQAENSKLKTLNSNLQTELAASKEDEIDILQLRDDVYQKSNELEVVTGERNKLKEALVSLNKDVEEMKNNDEADKLKSDINELTSTLNNIEDERNSLLETVAVMKDQIIKAEESMPLTGECDKLNEMVRDLEAQINELRTENEDVEEVTSETQHVEEILQQIRKNLENSPNFIDFEREKLKDAMQIMERHLENVKDSDTPIEADKDTDEFSEVLRQIRGLIDDTSIDDKDEQREKLKDAVTVMEQHVAEISVPESPKKPKLMRSMTKDVNLTLEQVKMDLEEPSLSVDEERNKLKDVVGLMEDHLEFMKNEHVANQHASRGVAEALSDLNTGLMTPSASLQEERDKLKRCIGVMEAQMATLKDCGVSDVKEKYKFKVDELNAEIAKLQEDRDALRDFIASSQIANTNQNTVEDAIPSEKSKKHSKEFQKSIQVLEQIQKDLENPHFSVEDERVKLNDAVAIMEQQLEVLKAEDAEAMTHPKIKKVEKILHQLSDDLSYPSDCVKTESKLMKEASALMKEHVADILENDANEAQLKEELKEEVIKLSAQLAEVQAERDMLKAVPKEPASKPTKNTRKTSDSAQNKKSQPKTGSLLKLAEENKQNDAKTDKMKEEIDTLTSKLSNIENERDNLQADVINLEKQLDSLENTKKENEIIKGDIDVLLSKIEEITNDRDLLRKSLEKLLFDPEIPSLSTSNEIDDLLEQMKNDLSSKPPQDNIEINAKLKEDVNELSSALAAVEDERDKLNVLVIQLQNSVDALQKETNASENGSKTESTRSGRKQEDPEVQTSSNESGTPAEIFASRDALKLAIGRQKRLLETIVENNDPDLENELLPQFDENKINLRKALELNRRATQNFNDAQDIQLRLEASRAELRNAIAVHRAVNQATPDKETLNSTKAALEDSVKQHTITTDEITEIQPSKEELELYLDEVTRKLDAALSKHKQICQDLQDPEKASKALEEYDASTAMLDDLANQHREVSQALHNAQGYPEDAEIKLDASRAELEGAIKAYKQLSDQMDQSPEISDEMLHDLEKLNKEMEEAVNKNRRMSELWVPKVVLQNNQTQRDVAKIQLDAAEAKEKCLAQMISSTINIPPQLMKRLQDAKQIADVLRQDVKRLENTNLPQDLDDKKLRLEAIQSKIGTVEVLQKKIAESEKASIPPSEVEKMINDTLQQHDELLQDLRETEDYLNPPLTPEEHEMRLQESRCALEDAILEQKQFQDDVTDFSDDEMKSNLLEILDKKTKALRECIKDNREASDASHDDDDDGQDRQLRLDASRAELQSAIAVHRALSQSDSETLNQSKSFLIEAAKHHDKLAAEMMDIQPSTEDLENFMNEIATGLNAALLKHEQITQDFSDPKKASQALLDYEASSANLADLANQYEQVSHSLQSVRGAPEDLAVQLDATRAELEAAIEAHKQLLAEFQESPKMTDEMVKRLKQLNDDIEIAVEKNRRMSEAWANAPKESIEDRQAQIDVAKTQLDAAEARERYLSEQMESTREPTSSIMDTLEDAREELNNLREEVVRLEEDFKIVEEMQSLSPDEEDRELRAEALRVRAETMTEIKMHLDPGQASKLSFKKQKMNQNATVPDMKQSQSRPADSIVSQHLSQEDQMKSMRYSTEHGLPSQRSLYSQFMHMQNSQPSYPPMQPTVTSYSSHQQLPHHSHQQLPHHSHQQLPHHSQQPYSQQALPHHSQHALPHHAQHALPHHSQQTFSQQALPHHSQQPQLSTLNMQQPYKIQTQSQFNQSPYSMAYPNKFYTIQYSPSRSPAHTPNLTHLPPSQLLPPHSQYLSQLQYSTQQSLGASPNIPQHLKSLLLSPQSLQVRPQSYSSYQPFLSHYSHLPSMDIPPLTYTNYSNVSEIYQSRRPNHLNTHVSQPMRRSSSKFINMPTDPNTCAPNGTPSTVSLSAGSAKLISTRSDLVSPASQLVSWEDLKCHHNDQTPPPFTSEAKQFSPSKLLKPEATTPVMKNRSKSVTPKSSTKMSKLVSKLYAKALREYRKKHFNDLDVFDESGPESADNVAAIDLFIS